MEARTHWERSAPTSGCRCPATSMRGPEMASGDRPSRPTAKRRMPCSSTHGITPDHFRAERSVASRASFLDAKPLVVEPKALEISRLSRDEDQLGRQQNGPAQQDVLAFDSNSSLLDVISMPSFGAKSISRTPGLNWATSSLAGKDLGVHVHCSEAPRSRTRRPPSEHDTGLDRSVSEPLRPRDPKRPCPRPNAGEHGQAETVHPRDIRDP